MFSGKHILIAPLDWGMGHATRCVPIINDLEKNNRILIGVTSSTKQIFRDTFPHINTVDLPEYKIKYARYLPVWLKILFDWPRINTVIMQENAALKNIIQQHQIDCVISDNRFGLYSKKIYCIFITNQLFIKAPFLNRAAQFVNQKFILRFNEVWVPDYEDEKISLSGELSHGKHFHGNIKYIGPQSRLNKVPGIALKYDFLILLSGPQPQHGILAEQFIEISNKYPHLKFAMTSSLIQLEASKNLDVLHQPNALELSDAILKSKAVICRSGYSTLMDMNLLGKKNLFLIPTKGQTEQEYLAKYWNKKYGTFLIQKNDLESIFTNSISID